MIEARCLTKVLDGTAVMDNLSFRMEEGGMYGIIGPNGAGKSTLLSLISGVEKPTSGELLLKGKPASDYPRKELAKWVAVLQQGGLIPAGFTVREVAAMGRFPFQSWLGEEKRDVSELLARTLAQTALTELADRSIDRLSGGERQRVALAKVMIQEPQLLLLDEPTTYLDIGYQVQLLDMVKSWQRQNRVTVVAVLHDLNLAAHYCDQLLVLQQGRIVATGSPEEVMVPSLIEQVYGTQAVIVNHPVTGKPQLLLQPSSL
ncbi:iron complex transport system ATP-binding protein [Paenibacillus phyllosphaerae]|uniref:Iron complex transport system ATP-binding protein n=1 Tax=Paenibacillus phyllosphaerae TaxID=274593 RepID=A0A7W5AVS4_9BACL|nr:heme ABC transporter ATP-binding protein [Paenibacillus phyllosphaerae]MBB3109487.1 iron complex transport system ATP-binding protein [Paenibacillus phyllosphaerae]